MLDKVTVTVTDKATGAKTTSQFKNGLLGFVGIEGHTYTIAVEDKNHRTQSQDVTIPANAGAQENIDLVFGDQQNADKNPGEKQTMVAGKLKDSQGNMLDEVTVTVTDKTTGAKTTSQFKNGLLDFAGVKGRTYTLSVEDKNHRVQSQDVTIPADAGAQENIDLVFGDQPNTDKNPGEKQTIVAGKLKDSQGFMLGEVTVTVTDKTTGAKPLHNSKWFA